MIASSSTMSVRDTLSSVRFTIAASLSVALAACAPTRAPVRPTSTASSGAHEVRPYYVNLIPFGAGQFQNGQRCKGLAFAISEATTAGLSAGRRCVTSVMC